MATPDNPPGDDPANTTAPPNPFGNTVAPPGTPSSLGMGSQRQHAGMTVPQPPRAAPHDAPLVFDGQRVASAVNPASPPPWALELSQRLGRMEEWLSTSQVAYSGPDPGHPNDAIPQPSRMTHARAAMADPANANVAPAASAAFGPSSVLAEAGDASGLLPIPPPHVQHAAGMGHQGVPDTDIFVDSQQLVFQVQAARPAALYDVERSRFVGFGFGPFSSARGHYHEVVGRSNALISAMGSTPAMEFPAPTMLQFPSLSVTHMQGDRNTLAATQATFNKFSPTWAAIKQILRYADGMETQFTDMDRRWHTQPNLDGSSSLCYIEDVVALLHNIRLLVYNSLFSMFTLNERITDDTLLPRAVRQDLNISRSQPVSGLMFHVKRETLRDRQAYSASRLTAESMRGRQQVSSHQGGGQNRQAARQGGGNSSSNGASNNGGGNRGNRFGNRNNNNNNHSKNYGVSDKQLEKALRSTMSGLGLVASESSRPPNQQQGGAQQ